MIKQRFPELCFRQYQWRGTLGQHLRFLVVDLRESLGRLALMAWLIEQFEVWRRNPPHPHSYACYRVYLKSTLTTGVESPVSKVSGGKEATVTSQGHVSGLPGWRKLWCLEAVPWHAPWFLVTFSHNWVNFCLPGSYLSLCKEKRYLHAPKKQCWYIFLSKLLGKERAMLCLVTQLCPTLCNPMDCSPPGSSVHRDSSGKNTGVGCHALLQDIFPTQGWNSDLPHGRRILYQLSHQGSPREQGALYL